jgi:peptide/nickel transport system substrate-binding protein
MRTRTLWLAALAAIVAALLTACGGGSEEAAAPPPRAGTEAAATGGAETEAGAGGGELEPGGIARIGTTGEIDSLNPFVGFNAESYVAWIMTYPMLVQYNSDLEVEGEWAESWEVSPDGKTWTFKVKTGQWSDGTPLTAADGAWMINTTVQYGDGPAGNLISYVFGVTNAEAPDDSTLVLTFEKPTPEGKFLEGLTQYPILPQHVWEQYTGNEGKDLKTYNPQDDLPIVAGGPFQITRFDKNGVTLFEKNPSFYGTPANVDAVGYQHFDNEDAMLTALQANELDYVDEVPQKAVETLQGNSDLEVETTEGSQVQNFIFNSNPDKPRNRELLDPKVREAFAHAIDRNEIADVVYAGYAKPTASLVAPYSGEWMNPDLQPEPFDIATANQILDDAGYSRGPDGIRVDKEGEKMEYEVIIPQGVVGIQREFEVAQKGLAEVGITLTPAVFDDTTAFEKIGAPDWKYEEFDLSMWDWVGLIDPDFVLSVLTCAQLGNFSDTGYCSEEYDAMYEEQSLEVDEDARRELVYEMQEKIYNERAYINLVVLDILTAKRADWSSYQPQIGGYSKRQWTELGKLA